MEYLPLGDLGTYLMEFSAIPEAPGKYVIRQILIALRMIHSKQLAHRDIKPSVETPSVLIWLL